MEGSWFEQGHQSVPNTQDHMFVEAHENYLTYASAFLFRVIFLSTKNKLIKNFLDFSYVNTCI